MKRRNKDILTAFLIAENTVTEERLEVNEINTVWFLAYNLLFFVLQLIEKNMLSIHHYYQSGINKRECYG
jgi:hypothetical protein